MTGVSPAARQPDRDDEEIREGLEGNLCRCTGYHNIVRAVQAVVWQMAHTTNAGAGARRCHPAGVVARRHPVLTHGRRDQRARQDPLRSADHVDYNDSRHRDRARAAQTPRRALIGFSAPACAARKTRGSSPAADSTPTTSHSGHACTPRSSAARTRTRASAASTCARGTRDARRRRASTPGKDLADGGVNGIPVGWLLPGLSRATTSRSRSTRCATSARRSPWSSPIRRTSRATRPSSSMVDYEPLPAVADAEQALGAGRAASCTTMRPTTSLPLGDRRRGRHRRGVRERDDRR